jgi:hypothetical protein
MNAPDPTLAALEGALRGVRNALAGRPENAPELRDDRRISRLSDEQWAKIVSLRGQPQRDYIDGILKHLWRARYDSAWLRLSKQREAAK